MCAVVTPGTSDPPTGKPEPASRNRLEQLRATLESLGHHEIGELGRLDVAGPVVPRTGVTLPRPDLYGEAVSVQRVLRARGTGPGGEVTLEVLQEPAVQL